jgi:hypothetical protein
MRKSTGTTVYYDRSLSLSLLYIFFLVGVVCLLSHSGRAESGAANGVVGGASYYQLALFHGKLS